jgi:two-component system sensor histidine kinase HydH
MLNRVFVRVAGPTIFVSLVLLVSCTAVAVYLHGQQRVTADLFGENVRSREVAHDLEVNFKDLLLVLEAQTPRTAANPAVIALHEQIRASLDEARRWADKQPEQSLVEAIATAFGQHEQLWRSAAESTKGLDAETFRALVQKIRGDALPKAIQIGEFNEDQINQSEAAHQRAVRQMSWGLAAVGVFGSIAGIVLGYGVSYSFRRSIHRLNIRVRDAADKLGRELPAVTLSDEGDLHSLHEQMQGVTHEIEQMVQRLQQREREVLRAEQMAAVGQLAAGVAHELRNPLTSIKMLVQKGRKQAGAAGLSADHLQIIEHEIHRMERCLQTFLDFARPPKPERRPTDLATLVERTSSLLEGRARHQRVRILFNRPPQPVTAEVDADQVQQLLVNLSLNALDAMSSGGCLTFEITELPGKVELRTIDTGPGISDEMLCHLFSPFVSNKETGLGLGLVVSRRIAEEHGGSLTAYNRPEGGACFTLIVPTSAPASGA